MRLATIVALTVGITAGSSVHAQSYNEPVTRAFMEICMKHAPSFQSDKVKIAFQKVGTAKFPRGVGALLRVVPAKSCGINLSGVALNADGSEPTVPLALEKQIMTDLAKRVGGEVSVYRPGKRSESWSVKVGKDKYRLQSIYKARRNSWDVSIYKN